MGIDHLCCLSTGAKELHYKGTHIFPMEYTIAKRTSTVRLVWMLKMVGWVDIPFFASLGICWKSLLNDYPMPCFLHVDHLKCLLCSRVLQIIYWNANCLFFPTHLLLHFSLFVPFVSVEHLWRTLLINCFIVLSRTYKQYLPMNNRQTKVKFLILLIIWSVWFMWQIWRRKNTI